MKKSILAFITAIAIIIAIFPTSYAATESPFSDSIKGYSMTDARFKVYSNRSTSKRSGTVYGDEDLLTILELYSDGWAKIKYPTASGKKTAYCQTSYLLIDPDFSDQKIKAQEKFQVYTKPDCSTKYGTISKGDKCFIVGNDGYATQVIYPVSSGYKMGWVVGVYTDTLANSSCSYSSCNSRLTADRTYDMDGLSCVLYAPSSATGIEATLDCSAISTQLWDDTKKGWWNRDNAYCYLAVNSDKFNADCGIVKMGADDWTTVISDGVWKTDFLTISGYKVLKFRLEYKSKKLIYSIWGKKSNSSSWEDLYSETIYRGKLTNLKFGRASSMTSSMTYLDKYNSEKGYNKNRVYVDLISNSTDNRDDCGFRDGRYAKLTGVVWKETQWISKSGSEYALSAKDSDAELWIYPNTSDNVNGRYKRSDGTPIVQYSESNGVASISIQNY